LCDNECKPAAYLHVTSNRLYSELDTGTGLVACIAVMHCAWSTTLTYTSAWVGTWMGDCLQAVRPSLYVTSHLGQLSLPSLWSRLIGLSGWG